MWSLGDYSLLDLLLEHRLCCSHGLTQRSIFLLRVMQAIDHPVFPWGFPNNYNYVINVLVDVRGYAISPVLYTGDLLLSVSQQNMDGSGCYYYTYSFTEDERKSLKEFFGQDLLDGGERWTPERNNPRPLGMGEGGGGGVTCI